MNPLNKQQIIDLLSLFNSDYDTVVMANKICETYLDEHPDDEKFRVRYLNKLSLFNRVSRYKLSNNLNIGFKANKLLPKIISKFNSNKRRW